MNDSIIDREMELSNFKRILTEMKMKHHDIDTVKLLGGEPSLHSRFRDIIELSLAAFPYVQIFTNGIFSPEMIFFLQTKVPRVKFTFNVMTPGFQLNQKVHKKVTEAIQIFAPLTEVTLSLTFDMHTDISRALNTVGDETLRIVKSFRLGFSNPIAGERNYYQFEDFPKVGEQLYRIMKKIRGLGSTATCSLNCGFTRCMFTDSQYEFLKKSGVEIMGFGCFGKASSVDIGTDMRAFHCFPLSTKDKKSINNTDISNVDQDFLKKRYEYWSKIRLSVCVKCPFYGHTPDKCPGPCIAFRMNSPHG